MNRSGNREHGFLHKSLISLAGDEDDESLADHSASVASPSCSSSANTAKFEMTLKHYEGASTSAQHNFRRHHATRSVNLDDADDHEQETCSNDNPPSSGPRPREEDNFTSDLDSEEILLSVFWRGGKLGAAYYTVETSEIHVIYDIVDVNPEFILTKCFFNQVQPSQVITSGRCAEKFITTLRSLTGGGDGNEVAGGSSCQLHIMPGKDFHYESCKARVLSLHLPGEPVSSATNEEAHHTYIHSLIDISSESTVFALGGLLRFLEKNWSDINLEVTDRRAPILALHVISLDDLVFMDPDSYSALQIFCPQAHPSVFKRWSAGSTREGLSVFGIFNRCRSTLGCKWMKVMFLHPSRNIQLLNERLDVIEFCIKQKNADVLQRMLECLKHVKSITRIMTKMQAAQASVREWKTLYKTVYHAVLVGELCAAQKEEIALFRKIADCLTDELYAVGQSINTFMDFDASEAQNKFVVMPGIDEELDRKKQKHAGLADLLSAVAHQELAALPPGIPQCSVVYIPEIGYLLALPVWKEDMTEEDFQLPGLQFMFKANQVAHFKSARCRELDDVLGDSLVHISEHEARIMVRLVQFVEARIQPISRITDLLAQLDCLAALASVAYEQGYVRPILSADDRGMEVKEGRHPLQELCVSEFVANPINLGGQYSSMQILTGPNASGKSVYLKQVGLIAYLAHIGSFVPAVSAKVGILRSIFTRIQTTESVATRLSAFMIDLRQMSLALNSSSSRSLLLVDEFGKGTSELDGLSLLASSLTHLLERGESCPLVLVSTHFHHLAKLLPPSPLLQMMTLEHLCESDGEIVYLFKLKEGRVDSSFAHQVAHAQGLDKDIVQRAEQVLGIMKRGETIERAPDSKISNTIQRHEKLARSFLTLNLKDDYNFKVVLKELVQQMNQ